jgi:hypothetical protein
MRPTFEWHLGVSKLLKLGLSQCWVPIILRADLQLRWDLKQSCSPRQELSNGMSHFICTQGNRVDPRLLVVSSQIANLSPNLSFGHNLCFRYPNGSCKPILDTCIPKAFQWYKKILKPLSFDSYNRPLKIWESIRTLSPSPKAGVALGV